MRKILCLLFAFLLPVCAIAEGIPVLVSIGVAAGTIQMNGRNIKAAGVGKYAPWGIHEASVIYENPLFEAGETRIAALFDGDKTIETGPIRSARISHFQQREEWNAILFFAGDGAALLKMPELQALSHTDRIFNHHRYPWVRACTRRVSGIRAPSNLSVSLSAVQTLREKEAAEDVSPIRHGEESLAGNWPDGAEVILDWGKPEYLVRLVWDQDAEHYLCFRTPRLFSPIQRLNGLQAAVFIWLLKT